jgi:hypothetical protein
MLVVVEAWTASAPADAALHYGDIPWPASSSAVTGCESADRPQDRKEK